MSLQTIFIDKTAFKPNAYSSQQTIASLQDIFASSENIEPKRSNTQTDLAALIYTSGSTGHPKGVMLSHLNMVSAANSIIEYLENTEKDIIINVHPLSFDYGLYQVLMRFKLGGTVVLRKNYGYQYSIIGCLQKENVSGILFVPTIASLLGDIPLCQLNESIAPIPALYNQHSRYITKKLHYNPPEYFHQNKNILYV